MRSGSVSRKLRKRETFSSNWRAGKVPWHRLWPVPSGQSIRALPLLSCIGLSGICETAKTPGAPACHASWRLEGDVLRSSPTATVASPGTSRNPTNYGNLIIRFHRAPVVRGQRTDETHLQIHKAHFQPCPNHAIDLYLDLCLLPCLSYLPAVPYHGANHEAQLQQAHRGPREYLCNEE